MINRMKDLAGLFGVNLGEKFNLKDTDGNYLKYDNPYRFTYDGLIDKDNDGVCSSMLCMQLIRGEFIVEKIPMTIEQKQRHLKESLKILKDHCVPRDDCEGCELYEVCNLLFEQRVKDWKLD